MRWVLDASSVVAYLLGKGSDAERRGMLDDVHTPGFVDVEVTQSLRGLLRGGKINLDVAERGRGELAQLRVRRHPDVRLLQRAWELRGACTIYDGLYVALAEALDATLLTRDGPLARGIAGLVPVVTSE